MALKPFVTAEDHAKLPAHFQAEYTKQADGRFLLQVETMDGYALENVKSLKEALGVERTARAAAEASAKGFEGLDPVAAKEAVERLKKVSEGKLDDKQKAQVDEMIRQLTEKHAKETSAKDGEIKDLLGHVNEFAGKQAAMAAIAKHGGKPSVLLPHVLSGIKVLKEGNTYVARVVDDKGNPRYSQKPNCNDAMGLDEFVESFKTQDDFKACFATAVKSGGGTQSPDGGKGGGAGSGGDFFQMSAAQMIDAGRAQSA